MLLPQLSPSRGPAPDLRAAKKHISEQVYHLVAVSRWFLAHTSFLWYSEDFLLIKLG